MTLEQGLCAALAMIVGASPASAQEPDYSGPEPVTFLDRYGFGLTIGGGVSGFTGDTMRDTTDDGGNWDVRATFGTRSFLAVEGSYLGSAQEIDTFGLDNDAVLISNGIQADLRLNATVDIDVQPFLYAGVAWRRYDLMNADFNTSDVQDEDDVLEIPMGFGVAWRGAGFLLDARAEFRGATSEDMVPVAITDDRDGSAAMHRWGINANLGYEW